MATLREKIYLSSCTMALQEQQLAILGIAPPTYQSKKVVVLDAHLFFVHGRFLTLISKNGVVKRQEISIHTVLWYGRLQRTVRIPLGIWKQVRLTVQNVLDGTW